MSRFSGSFGACCLILVGLLGCDNGSKSAEVLTFDAARRIIDAGPDSHGGTPIQDADPSTDGTGPIGDGSVPDSSLPALANCEDICDYYVECDRLDIWTNRRRSACVDACNEVAELDAFERYRICLQTTPCDGLQECRLPQRPRPSCDQVCDALATCGADARLPGALEAVADCESGCDTPSIAVDIQRCGEPMAMDPTTCDEPTFALCLLREQAPECTAVCEQLAMCEGLEDVIGCAIDCLAGPQPEDPVARRRIRIQRNCAQRAVTCEEFSACGGPAVGSVDPADVAALCAADAACGFFGDECPPRADTLLRTSSDGTLQCAVEQLENDCDTGLLSCLRPASQPLESCDEYCAIASLCGRLPVGLLELECAMDCRAAIDSADHGRMAAYGAGLRCAYTATCEDFIACIGAGSGSLDCQGPCAERARCEIGDAETCVADCEPRRATIRNWAERTCTGGAADCVGVPKCIAPTPPPCTALCDLLSSCDLGSDDCAQRCDDADYLTPGSFLPRYACLVSTDRCNARADCEDPDLRGGFACLNWCRHQTGCQGDSPEMFACINQCSAGLPGRDGLAFEAAYDCLTDAGLNAACEPLQACLVAVEPAALCATACAEEARCTFVDDLPACQATCLEAVQNDDLQELQCVLASIRRQSGCAEVAQCLGLMVEPASEGCAALCQARARCDVAVDTFLCERECTPDPEELPIRRACSALAECEQMNLCLGDPALVPQACIDACATTGQCPGLIGGGDGAVFASDEDCRVHCAAQGLLSEGAIPQGLSECLEQAMCDGDSVRGCFEGRAPLNCSAGWDAIVLCNNQPLLQFAGINNRADYVRICEEQFGINPMQVEQDLQCLTDVATRAAVDPAACADQVACFLGGLGP